MKTILSVLMASVLAAACSSPPTRQEVGIASGAVVGGVVGAVLTGGSTVGLAAGAAGGAVMGRELTKNSAFK